LNSRGNGLTNLSQTVQKMLTDSGYEELSCLTATWLRKIGHQEGDAELNHEDNVAFTEFVFL